MVGLFTKKQTNAWWQGDWVVVSSKYLVLVKPYVKTNIRMELLWWKEGVGPLFSPDPLPVCERQGALW